VQVVVELPGLVADDKVVAGVAHDVVEDHEVGAQDLVHTPERVEAVQVVLGGFGLEVARLRGQVLAGGMDRLALGLEHARDRVLRQPLDLEVGLQSAQLASDRDVPPRVTQSDRRGDEQHPPSPIAGLVHDRVSRRPALLDEVAHREVEPHRLAPGHRMAGPHERDETAVRGRG
jgi:hypothetical protein